ncbi:MULTISPECIES: hypothetical protein [unclassified Sodalis]|uniref:hypothetical protein n=1 Tax=Sodalis TaxID=84565 RepID=UPI00093B5E47|nr:hypothetical protein [Candidatus Sodalis sp. SoCistrobi]
MDFFDKIKHIFNPKYSYTLDYSAINIKTGIYTFKEYGTHSYIKKSYKQIIESNFIYLINPKDIIYISKIEEKKAMQNDIYFITEERRDGIYKISNNTDMLLISGKDILKNNELINKINNGDMSKIAYLEGIHAGREISEALMKKTPLKMKKNNILQIIK